MNVQRTIALIRQANTALKDEDHVGSDNLKQWRRIKRKQMKRLASMIGPEQVKQLSLYGK